MLNKEFDSRENENVLLRSNYHPGMFYGGIFFLFYAISIYILFEIVFKIDSMSLFFFLLGIVWTLFGFFKWTYTEYVLTNQRLVVITGYYYLRAESIPIDKIEHVTLRQYWNQKWLDTGVVTLFGIGIRTKRIKGLNDAGKFKNAIQSQLSVDPEPYFSN